MERLTGRKGLSLWFWKLQCMALSSVILVGKTKVNLAELENILMNYRICFVWFGSSSPLTSYFPTLEGAC